MNPPKPIEERLWADEMSDVETASISSCMEESAAMEDEKDQQDQTEESYEKFFQLYVELEKRIRKGAPNLQAAGTFYSKDLRKKE